jgi:hypothetical protein
VRPPTPIPITPHIEVIFNPEKFEDNFYLQIKCEKKRKKNNFILGTSVPS